MEFLASEAAAIEEEALSGVSFITEESLWRVANAARKGVLMYTQEMIDKIINGFRLPVQAVFSLEGFAAAPQSNSPHA